MSIKAEDAMGEFLKPQQSLVNPDFYMIRLKKAASEMDYDERMRLAKMLVIYFAELSKRKL